MALGECAGDGGHMLRAVLRQSRLGVGPELYGPAFSREGDDNHFSKDGLSAYGAVAVVLLVVALLANAVPTLRATRAHPLDSLRA
jgi:hypothetical protein